MQALRRLYAAARPFANFLSLRFQLASKERHRPSGRIIVRQEVTAIGV